MNNIVIGFRDLLESLRLWRLWSLLGWLEIRQRYARSILGPFWLTISMGVLVGTMGVVYGVLLGQTLSTYLPTVAIGIVVWALFSSIVSEGSSAYIMSANYIRQVKTPRIIYIFQVSWKSLVIFMHNALIIVVIFAFIGIQNLFLSFLSVLGILLLLLNATWIGAFAGLVSARFRDFPQMVQALLQVAFYVTPILFEARMLGKYDWIVRYNPLSYSVNIIREPLMGQVPSQLSWFISLSMAICGWLVVLYLTGKYHKRIPYWV
jgi:lipopolysaccharide transport system permease protein